MVFPCEQQSKMAIIIIALEMVHGTVIHIARKPILLRTLKGLMIASKEEPNLKMTIDGQIRGQGERAPYSLEILVLHSFTA